MRYALVNKDGEVINIVAWDGQTEYNPPDKCKLVECTQEHDTQFADYSKSQVPDIPESKTDNLIQALVDKGVITESDVEAAS